MDLLTSADVAAIRGALKDAKDTFLKRPIKVDKVVHRFGAPAPTYTEYDFLALFVESSGQTDIVQRKERGAYDDSDGYFLVDFAALEAAGLVAGGVPTVNATTDLVSANGMEYQIMGVHPVGDLRGQFEAVRLMVKRDVKRV
jgi:hypothetical protein